MNDENINREQSGCGLCHHFFEAYACAMSLKVSHSPDQASRQFAWHYTDNLPAVLGWTVGVTLGTALNISRLLRWKMKV